MEKILLPTHRGDSFEHHISQPPKETNVFSLLSLRGKTAIVSGGGGGIGFAVVEAFAEAGANVALWYNSSKVAVEKAASISKTYGVMCRAYQVNVSDEQAVESAVEQAVQDLNGHLDIFVANAAITWINGSIVESTTADFQNLLNTNLMSVYFSAKAVGKQFKKQKDQQTGNTLNNDSPSFIITSSIAGMKQLLPQSFAPYSIVKAALTHFAKCLAVEWTAFARVNCISPGYVITGMLEPAPDTMRDLWKGRTPMGREGSVAELKAAYLYLASNASSFTTGSNLVIDGGYTCV
ncbi:Sorbose reductase sou1 [Orbilia ellipsospora]|uniref:Sorbose reductase sou1 n=1 Tax=Orbilia ellipsospora TaxID=2528407 RepID=A0AAV9WT23_9PEZI